MQQQNKLQHPSQRAPPGGSQKPRNFELLGDRSEENTGQQVFVIHPDDSNQDEQSSDGIDPRQAAIQNQMMFGDGGEQTPQEEDERERQGSVESSGQEGGQGA